MNSASGVSGRFFSALGRANINVLAISQGSSERNISAVVDTKHAARALRAVHSGTAPRAVEGSGGLGRRGEGWGGWRGGVRAERSFAPPPPQNNPP